jgi:hypothetical protein
VATFRYAERTQNEQNDPGVTLGSRGWMCTAEAEFNRLGLQEYWQNPDNITALQRDEWKDKVYKAVDSASNAQRAARLLTLTSTRQYTKIKDWGVTKPKYAFSSGEIDRLGQHVSERYLDDRRDLKGTRLKLLCRTNCMPLMPRVVREARASVNTPSTGHCLCCAMETVETVQHLLLECPLYARHRSTMIADTERILTTSTGTVSAQDFRAMDLQDKLQILLGGRIDDPTREDLIDRSVKRYLRKAWNARAPINCYINRIFKKSYSVHQRIEAVQ